MDGYRYNDFVVWKIIFHVLKEEKHLDLVFDKEKQTIGNINEMVVDTILKEKYMDGSHLDILKTMFNIILDNPSKSSDSGFPIPYLDSSILNILGSFKLASLKDTSEGYALFSSFKSISDMVVIKTSKKKKDNMGILYEYFIGTIGINKLRSLIPNFTYTLAIFKSNPLHIEEDKTISSDVLHNDSDTRYYVVYEKIKGISIDEYIKNMTDKGGDGDKLINYIIQIAFSLVIAQREIGFVHYDLHTDNIILRTLSSPKVVDYDIDGITYRIETDAIPTIIDYGFSHFVHEGVPLGIKTIPKLGIIPTLTSNGIDLYKVIMFMMNSIFHHKSSSLFNKVSWIMGYYKNDPFGIDKAYQKRDSSMMNSALDVGWKSFYNVTRDNSPDIYNDSPINFLNWIKTTNKKFWDKSIKSSDSLYNIPSNNLIESYTAKLEGRRIFNTETTDDLDNCEILENDHHSYVINRYISNEFSKILEKFEENIKNPTSLRKKIKDLNSKNENNIDLYMKNDQSLLEIYTDELNNIQKSILLSDYEKKLGSVNNVLDIKRLDRKMKIIHSYIEIYNNYRKFVEYSRVSSRLISDQSIDEYHSRAVTLYKKYEQRKSEYIFDMLRQQLDIIDNNENADNEHDSQIIESLIIIQYVLDDIRTFYPDIDYAYIDIEKYIYEMVYNLKEETIYVPPRSNIQFLLACRSSKVGVSLILKKYITSDTEDIINKIVSEKITDDNVLDVVSASERNNSPIDLSVEFKFFTSSKEFKSLKMKGDMRYLDLGSRNLDRNILDVFGIENITVVNLREDGMIGPVKNSLPEILGESIVSNVSRRIPFENEYFSLITSFMVFHTISDIDIEHRLQEIKRIMKIGGILLMREYDGGDQYQKLLADIDRRIDDDPTVYSFYQSTSEWKNLLREQGFRWRGEKRDTPFTIYTYWENQ